MSVVFCQTLLILLVYWILTGRVYATGCNGILVCFLFLFSHLYKYNYFEAEYGLNSSDLVAKLLLLLFVVVVVVFCLFVCLFVCLFGFFCLFVSFFLCFLLCNIEETQQGKAYDMSYKFEEHRRLQ